MTALHSNVASLPRRNGRAQQRVSKPRIKSRILAAVDGSEGSNGIVDYLIKLAKRGDPIEVIVLNVQSLSESFRLRGYGSFKQDVVRERLTSDFGKPIVDGVVRRLRKAGISSTAHVEIGEPVETIVRYATAGGCDLVIVGHPRPGPFRQWIARHARISFGSVATTVSELADIPVVVVN